MSCGPVRSCPLFPCALQGRFFQSLDSVTSVSNRQERSAIPERIARKLNRQGALAIRTYPGWAAIHCSTTGGDLVPPAAAVEDAVMPGAFGHVIPLHRLGQVGGQLERGAGLPQPRDIVPLAFDRQQGGVGDSA